MTAARISSYRDLNVWQAAMHLAEDAYRVANALPDKESFGLAQQIQRAAVSIPSNIAEGHSRDSSREFLHYLSIAAGSLAELETQVELAARLSYLSEADVEVVRANAVSTGKMLRALQRAIKARVRSRS